MTAPPSLPTGAPPFAAMDYARLRAEGVRLLGSLAGGQWTDFNTHDPGITILEQLCYAITDLGYRINYPMADLLAGGEAAGLPGPASILTGDPVSSIDLRKAVLDVQSSDGVPLIANAWLEDAGAAGLAFYHHDGSKELRLEVDESRVDARPVALRGLWRVLLQPAELSSRELALARVTERLHRGRLLCEDFELLVLNAFPVSLNASIEVSSVDDPVAVLADVVECIERCLAPPAHFLTHAEARSRDVRSSELFEGPPLDRGYVDVLPDPRRVIYVSDLVHAITDVREVRAVPVLELTPEKLWVLPVPASSIGTLARSSTLRLLRSGLPLQVSLEQALARLAERRRAQARESADTRQWVPPVGRDRALARHHSLRRQLPAAYGVGPLGLSGEATAERRAQARQLEAYLLVFDQLLANAFAQLAHAHDLLSADAGGTRSYFAQPAADPPLELAPLLVEPEQYAAWLDAQMEPTGSLERRKRFLAHLLARFGEQVGDRAWVRSSDADASVVAVRQAFLQQIARLGGARGSGPDLLERDGEPAGGLQERLRLKLGLPAGVRFYVVEHVLLRPLPEDIDGQRAEEGEEQVPLLAEVTTSDPWSLQVSYVFPELAPADPELEALVVQTIISETPAHLSAQLHWFGDGEGSDDFSAFESDWRGFQQSYRAYRAASLLGGRAEKLAVLRVRDTRDRVIDRLGFGRTYPLRDVPLPAQLFVASGSSTSVTLEYSQPDVDYQLRDYESGQPIARSASDPSELPAVRGTGGPLPLPTPPVVTDVRYRVLALKREPSSELSRRQTWLAGAVSIAEGIDKALLAELRLPALDPNIQVPKPSDARLSHYHERVEVELHASQEGVSYELVDHADPTRSLSDPVLGIGTAGTGGGRIVLVLRSAEDDVDLRVRASREVTGAPGQRDSSLLEGVLSLRVRANPGLKATLDPAIVAAGGSSKLQLAQPQPGVSYRAWQQAVRDRDFAFDAAPAPETIEILDGQRSIRLRRPERAAIWKDLGFTPLGSARAGTGATLELLLGAFERDTFLLVEAAKEHRIGLLSSNSGTLRSATQLATALAVLVRPNAQQPLRVQVLIANAATSGPLSLSGGQPGVFYELRSSAGAPGILPAYFHQRDDVDATLNKGIEQLRVEVDFAIPRDRSFDATQSRAGTPPLDPLLDTPALPAGSVLNVFARKALSGLEQRLSRDLTLDAVPAVRAEPAQVQRGKTAEIVVEQSVVGDHYSLLLDEALLGEARAGDGKQLAFATGPLSKSRVFVLAIERVAAAGLPVQRRVEVRVEVAADG